MKKFMLFLLAFIFAAGSVFAYPIFIRTLTGASTIIEVCSSDTIRDIKVKINNSMKIPEEKQKLFYEGRLLDDSRKLSDYKIYSTCSLHLVVEKE